MTKTRRRESERAIVNGKAQYGVTEDGIECTDFKETLGRKRVELVFPELDAALRMVLSGAPAALTATIDCKYKGPACAAESVHVRKTPLLQVVGPVATAVKTGSTGSTYELNASTHDGLQFAFKVHVTTSADVKAPSDEVVINELTFEERFGKLGGARRQISQISQGGSRKTPNKEVQGRKRTIVADPEGDDDVPNTNRVLSLEELVEWLWKYRQALERRLDALEAEVKRLHENQRRFSDRPVSDEGAPGALKDEVFANLPEEQRQLFQQIMHVPVRDKGSVAKAEQLLRKLVDAPATKPLTEALRLVLRHFQYKVRCPSCGAPATPVWQAGDKYAEGGILKFYHRDRASGADVKHSATTSLPRLRLIKVPRGGRPVTLRW